MRLEQNTSHQRSENIISAHSERSPGRAVPVTVSDNVRSSDHTVPPQVFSRGDVQAPPTTPRAGSSPAAIAIPIAWDIPPFQETIATFFPVLPDWSKNSEESAQAPPAPPLAQPDVQGSFGAHQEGPISHSEGSGNHSSTPEASLHSAPPDAPVYSMEHSTIGSDSEPVISAEVNTGNGTETEAQYIPSNDDPAIIRVAHGRDKGRALRSAMKKPSYPDPSISADRGIDQPSVRFQDSPEWVPEYHVERGWAESVWSEEPDSDHTSWASGSGSGSGSGATADATVGGTHAAARQDVPDRPAFTAPSEWHDLIRRIS